MFKKITLAIVGLLAPIALALPVHAADEEKKPAVWLQISPVSNRVVMNASESLEYTFNVENIGSEAFSYHVYAAPYSIMNSDYEVNFSTENSYTQLFRWITFKESSGNFVDRAGFTIQPGDKHTIEYKINVPADIPSGGQSATIFAESDPSGDTNPTGIKTVSRVGLVIYGRSAGDTKEVATISDYRLDSFLTSGNVNSSAVVKNEGNTDFETSYKLLVKSLFGKTVFEQNSVYDVLPETSRNVKIEWGETPRFGIFHVTASVSALDQIENSTKIVIIMPVFVIILAILVLTFLVVWLIILIRKRKSRKSRFVI